MLGTEYKMLTQREKGHFRLTRGLAELMILQSVETESINIQQLTQKFSQVLRMRFTSTTVRAILRSLEKKGYISEEKKFQNLKLKTVYSLTVKGRNLLGYSGSSLTVGCANALLPAVAEISVVGTLRKL